MNFSRSALVACVALCAGFAPRTLAARELSAANTAELKSALDHAQPGDVLTLKNGTWLDAKIAVHRGGEPGKLLTIRAATPGGAVFAGASVLELNAPYVAVDGLFFHKGALKKGAVLQFNSHHGTVRNTAVVDYNPASFETKYYWVFFRGDSNLVDRCFFKGKNNMQPLVGNDELAARHNAVTGSYFKDIPFNEANGREIFRIWGYGRSEELGTDGAFFTIASNLFDHADGEGAEIISLKSNHNRVQHNTILATRGGINIRAGNWNTIEDNIILGQGLKGTDGVRLSGQHHLIQNNFISGCEQGIQVSCGEFFEQDLTGSFKPVLRAGTPLGRVPHYAQVKDLTLLGNTVIDTKRQDLTIGANYKKRWPEQQDVLLPEDGLIASNILVRSHGGESLCGTAQESAAPLDRFAFKPNRYEGNLLIGGVNSCAPAAHGCRQQPYPSDWPARQNNPAFQPLTPADVGPDWLRNTGF